MGLAINLGQLIHFIHGKLFLEYKRVISLLKKVFRDHKNECSIHFLYSLISIMSRIYYYVVHDG